MRTFKFVQHLKEMTIRNAQVYFKCYVNAMNVTLTRIEKAERNSYLKLCSIESKNGKSIWSGLIKYKFITINNRNFCPSILCGIQK